MPTETAERELTILVGNLQPGDYVPVAMARVVGTQRIAHLVIVDFDDMTATAPMPCNAPVIIRRKE